MEKVNTSALDREIVIEQTYNAPVGEVWNALTDKDLMKQWYFDVSDFKPQPGFEFTFTGGTDEKKYLHLCKVREAIENRRISYTWRYEGYQGTSLVTFDLFEEGSTTRVVLTHAGLESFAINDNPDFAKENFIMGWTHIIGTSLKEFIERNVK
jgi:uncharacterized protein YndB with AHSA1/START domain